MTSRSVRHLNLDMVDEMVCTPDCMQLQGELDVNIKKIIPLT